MKLRSHPVAAALGAVFLAAVTLRGADEPERPRGIWFWSKTASPHGAANVVGRAERETEALAVFRRWQIRRVYGSYGAMPKAAPGALAAWNRRLDDDGIRSESLFSDAASLAPKGRAVLLRQIDERVLRFNAGRTVAAERFDGVALDIEPHSLARWKDGTPGERRRLLEDFLALCAALRSHLDAQGGRDLTLSAALATWLDRLPPEGRVGWKSPADRDGWFTRLADSVANISLMAYERNRTETVLEATAWERAHFPGRTITALRARLGAEWRTVADLRAVLPEVEAASVVGVDIENYDLLRGAEAAASR